MSEERTISELVQELGASSRQLIRQEIRLARAEIVASAQQVRRGLVWIAAALVPAAMALVVIPLAIVWALDGAMPRWLAATIVAVALLVVTAIAIGVAVRRFKKAELPHQTLETLKEDARWLRDRLS